MAHWAISDLHGYYNFYTQVKDIIAPKDTVVCLGDCGDRGPQSWKTIKAVLSDPQFIYLKGNHEDMLVNALKAYLIDDKDFMYDPDVRLCWNNDGHQTFFAALEETDVRGVIKVLNNLPLEYAYIAPSGQKIILSHAGFTPGKEKDLLWDRCHFNDEWDSSQGIDFVIHGHTPIRNFKGEPRIYCNGHKINIDAGAFFNKKGLLFNLDNFKYIVFDLV